MYSVLTNMDETITVGNTFSGFRRIVSTMPPAATRRYDAFGNTDASSGTWNSPFGYAGGFGYQDDGSGLKLLGHRLYDASVGRFVSRDPAKHGGNWYGYCGNNSINAIDQDGRRMTFLYVLRDAFENIIKFGITRNPRTRYSARKLKELGAETMDLVTEYNDGLGEYKGGPYDKHALADERTLVREMPGPENHELWAGKDASSACLAVVSLLAYDPVGLSEALGESIGPWILLQQSKRQSWFDRWTDDGIDHG